MNQNVKKEERKWTLCTSGSNTSQELIASVLSATGFGELCLFCYLGTSSFLSLLRGKVVTHMGRADSRSTWAQLPFDSRTEGKRGSLFLELNRVSLGNSCVAGGTLPVLSPALIDSGAHVLL